MSNNTILYDISDEIVNIENITKKNNYKVIYGWKEPNNNYYIDFYWLNEKKILAYKNIYDNIIIYGIECHIDDELNRYIDFDEEQILFNAYAIVCDFYDYYGIDRTELTFFYSNTIIDEKYINDNKIHNYYPFEETKNSHDSYDEED
jgi:hypothetical protein